MRLRVIVFLTMGVLAASPVAALQRVYVALLNADAVAVFDADSRTVLRAIAVGDQPDGLAVSPDGACVYVANFGSASVSVIDTATDQVVATVAVGDGPVGLAVSPDGAALYVTAREADAVVVVDTDTNTVGATIAVGRGPNALAFTVDGSRVLVTNSRGDGLSVIDTATRRVIDTRAIGEAPNRIVISRDGRRAYVSLFGAERIAVLDLPELSPAGFLNAGRTTALALSADGGTLVAGAAYSLQRYDTTRLVRIGSSGVVADAVLWLAGQGPLLLADRAGDALRVVASGFGEKDFPPPPPLATVPLPGGPFALAALPRPDVDPVRAVIHAPALGFKLDAHDRAEVRITAAAGEQALVGWTLRLERLDGGEPEQVLAAGVAPVFAAGVATLDGASLTRGVPYRLRLEVQAADASLTTRERSFIVPDRQYAMVPLEPARQGDITRFEMDAEGNRFVRWHTEESALEVRDTVSGTISFTRPGLQLTAAVAGPLSADGSSVVFGGRLVLDVDSGLVRIFPPAIRGGASAIDGAGRFVVAFAFEPPKRRYLLVDSQTGDFVRLSAGERPGPPICRPAGGNVPFLSADASRVVFVSGLNLGFEDAAWCNVFTIDRVSGARRLVAAYPQTGVMGRSLDEAGHLLGLVISPDGKRSAIEPRAWVVDLDSGAQTQILTSPDVAQYDAVLAGDGSAIIISSCADLDPSVGNADGNTELFRYDLATQRVAQITDTRGGSGTCEQRDGYMYDPDVSRDGHRLSFLAHGRSLRNGLAFAAVRTVPIAADNRPPSLSVSGALPVRIGGRVRIEVGAGDPDGDPVALFAEVDELPALPPNSSIGEHPDHLWFEWRYTPPDSVGAHVLRVGAFDGRGGEIVREVPFVVCRAFFTPDNLKGVILALFEPPPPACGSADANADGAVSAADLTVARVAARQP